MIPPALTAEEWGNLPRWRDQSCPEKAIAIANARLLDTDPRKLTWAMVDGLRETLGYLDTDTAQKSVGGILERLADAIESHLPPRTGAG